MAMCVVGCGSRNEAPQADAARLETPAAGLATADSRPVIACFGDSLSAGFGLEGGKSYPEVLQQLVDKKGYRYRVVNLGVSGDTTTNGVERLETVLAVKPAIVILEFGGNDGLRGLPVASSEKNLSVMVERLQKSGARVVLAGMSLPLNYGAEYIKSFENIFVTVAKKYKLVRIPFLLEGVGGHADLVQQDGIHPTEQGTQIVATTVMKFLEPILDK
ncbi:MAG: lipolytic enzyme family [Bryobacterales bacterium]|nr:lipolytic enzyme family [Bryobacterales bacterium]